MARLGRHTLTAAQMLCAAVLALAATAYTQQPAAPAQGQTGAQTAGQGAESGRRGQYAGMGRVAGEVTSVAGNTVTVKTEDGSSVQVVTTDNTRVVKARGPVKVTDLRPGDGLMAIGNMDAATHTLHAAVVMAEDAAQLQAMRENMGKTYITGRVTAIDLDNAKMTVERPDHVAQTIGLDETTSFKRAVRGERAGGGTTGSGGAAPSAGGENGNRAGGGYGGGVGRGMGMTDPTAALDRGFTNGESITLADIKVGDFVLGTGSVKGGTFVPTRLLDSPPGQRRQRDGNAAPANAPGTAAQPGAGVPPPQ